MNPTLATNWKADEIPDADAAHRGSEAAREGGDVEIAELAEDGSDDSATSTNSAAPHPHEAVYPADSVLETFMAFAREFSESEDAILIGALLPVVAGLLARRVFIPFGERKYPNLFHGARDQAGLAEIHEHPAGAKTRRGAAAARLLYRRGGERSGVVQTIPPAPGQSDDRGGRQHGAVELGQ